MQQQGYRAEGIEGKFRGKDQERIPNLHHGELTALESVFGDKTFDLIVARGVFSFSSQMDYKYGANAMLVWLYSTPEEREKISISLQKTFDQMLKSAYNHLTPRGFLILVEDIVSEDSIGFSKETAVEIGYIVEKLERQEAIFKKPNTNGQ